MALKNILLTILIAQSRLEKVRRETKINQIFCFGSEQIINIFRNLFFSYVIEYISHQWQKLGFNYSVATMSFDCDLKEDYQALPFVLDMLKRNNIKASFAIIGKWIEIYPDIHKRIIEEGHEIINHTYTHPNNKHFSPDRYMVKLSLQEKKEEIARCHEVCEKILKYSPTGYRAPHLGSSHGVEIYSILKELNYKYSTSDIALRFESLGAPLKINNIWEFPLSPSTRNLFSSPITSEVIRDKKITEQQYYSDIRKAIDIAKTPFFFNIYCDPMDVVKMEEFESMLVELNNRFKMMTYKELIALLERIYGKG